MKNINVGDRVSLPQYPDMIGVVSKVFDFPKDDPTLIVSFPDKHVEKFPASFVEKIVEAEEVDFTKVKNEIKISYDEFRDLVEEIIAVESYGYPPLIVMFSSFADKIQTALFAEDEIPLDV